MVLLELLDQWDQLDLTDYLEHPGILELLACRVNQDLSVRLEPLATMEDPVPSVQLDPQANRVLPGTTEDLVKVALLVL